MTALYLERYLNYGLSMEELRSGRPIIGASGIENLARSEGMEYVWLGSKLGALTDDGVFFLDAFGPKPVTVEALRPVESRRCFSSARGRFRACSRARRTRR